MWFYLFHLYGCHPYWSFFLVGIISLKFSLLGYLVLSALRWAPGNMIMSFIQIFLLLTMEMSFSYILLQLKWKQCLWFSFEQKAVCLNVPYRKIFLSFYLLYPVIWLILFLLLRTIFENKGTQNIEPGVVYPTTLSSVLVVRSYHHHFM